MLRKSLIVGITTFTILFIFILGIVLYSYSQVNISLVDVSFVEISLEDLSLFDLVNLSLDILSGNWDLVVLEVVSEIDVGINLELTNNGFFPIYVPDVYYDLSVNEILVGDGYSKVNTMINPGESKKIEVFQNLQKTSLIPTIESIINDQGMMTVQINGTANFELFGQNIPLSFETNKQISIFDEILNKINQQKEN